MKGRHIHTMKCYVPEWKGGAHMWFHKGHDRTCGHMKEAGWRTPGLLCYHLSKKREGVHTHTHTCFCLYLKKDKL